MKRSYTHIHFFCKDCNGDIEPNVYDYSLDKFKKPLCLTCQKKYKTESEKATPEAKSLYLALVKRGVPAKLEKYVGRMTVDIAIPNAMVNIEVDGMHHNSSPKQALADLKRTYYAFKKGYLILRIPNTLVKSNLDEAAQFITDFLKESRDQLNH